MRLECPWCGARNQDEFICGGQAHITRPEHPDEVTDQEWAHYQFVRHNPQGLHFERWMHLYGCGQWFHVARNTLNHEILTTYGIQEQQPGNLQ
jgi:heterotetrameric sarcosine oxidase delta subunit